MEHGFLDKYSGLDSIIHRIDPRVKLITFGITIPFIIFTRPDLFLAFLLYGILIVTLIFISKIPFFFVLKKSLVVVPFVLLIAVFIPFHNGLLVFWNVLIKSYLSTLCMILFSNTTKFTDLLKALETLKFPKLIIMVLSFMYRYVYVSIDELMRMKRAKDVRTINSGTWLRFKTLSNIIGTLFIRAYERGERVYLAMRSRGFTGQIRTLNGFQARRKDFYFAAIITGTLILIRVCL